MLRHTLGLVVDEVRALEAKIAGVDRQLAQIAAAHPVASRLQTIPGVGVLTATALVGVVNHIHAFRSTRTRIRELAGAHPCMGFIPENAKKP